jgi:hypothetical protein
MKTEFFVMPFLFVLIVGPVAGQSNEEFLKKKFLSEYPEVLKAWEVRCSSAVGTVKYISDTRETPKRKIQIHNEFVYSFKCNLPDMALLTSNSNDAEGRLEQEVRGYNQNYFFS